MQNTLIYFLFFIFLNNCRDRLHKKGEDEDGQWSIRNSIFSVTLDPSLNISNLPLFGARYNFKLHDVVDLPEYLVHFPLLQKYVIINL